MTSPAPEVFLSYSRNDLDAAERLPRFLRLLSLWILQAPACGVA